MTEQTLIDLQKVDEIISQRRYELADCEPSLIEKISLGMIQYFVRCLI